MKYAAIQSNRSRYSITKMCQYFNVSRSGYYSFTKRMDVSDKDENLASVIQACQLQTNYTYGYRRVRQWIIRETGEIVNHKAVLRVMNKYGLLAQIRRRRKYIQYSKAIHRYSNTLNRDFSANYPNQKWVTDISYIHTKQGVLYLSVIKDLFDNSIVAYNTATTQNVNLVLDTIRKAKKKETATAKLQLHSDQGFQYTSHGYFNLTESYGIKQSMSRRGNCLDNAPAENFFGIIKAECINRVQIKTFSEALKLIDEYIHFYNYERIQLKTKLTPYEKRRQLA